MKNKPVPRGLRTISIIATKAEQLYTLLLDRGWHSTQELVQRVGHSFAVAKWRLVQLGYDIAKRRKSGDKTSYEYRLNRQRNAANDQLDGFGKR